MYLIRHDQVGLEGLCYGQSDIDSIVDYQKSALKIKPYIPTDLKYVYTSPLRRCAMLAECLFPSTSIRSEADIMEVNFGQWEQQAWSHIPRDQIDIWARTPTHFQFPEGEHLYAFYQRVADFWSTIADDQEDICLVTHAGVIRVLKSVILDKPWQDCLSMSVPFLSVIELNHRGVFQKFPNDI